MESFNMHTMDPERYVSYYQNLSRMGEINMGVSTLLTGEMSFVCVALSTDFFFFNKIIFSLTCLFGMVERGIFKQQRPLETPPTPEVYDHR